MIGTSAFESIVPNIVAASRLAVARRAIGRGTRASLKRMLHRPSANAADSAHPPERLRRSGKSVDRAHSPHRRYERTARHSRSIAGARRVYRGPEDRAGRLRPGTRRDRTQDPHGLLQLARPQTPLRASPTAPRGVSATPAPPRRGSDGTLDVQASAVLLGRSPRHGAEGTRPHPDDGGQGTDGPSPEGPLEKPRQRSTRVRAPAQAEDVEPRATAAVPGRGAAEHRRDPRPKSPGALRHGASRLRRVRRGTRAHAKDRSREGRGDRAPRQRRVRRRTDAPGGRTV